MAQLSHATVTKSNGVDQVSSGVGVFAMGFEVALCLTLLRYEVQHLPVPCVDAICARISRDPLTRPLGVYLPWYGLALSAAAIIARMTAKVTLSARLILLGCVASLLLTGYQVIQYHAICGWCSFSATSWCVAAAVDVLSGVRQASPGRYNRLVMFAALVLSIASEALFTRHLTANTLDFGGTDGNSLIRASRSVSSNPGYSETEVLFVEMECGACRHEMQTILSNAPETNVSIACAKVNTEYDRQAAMLLLDCRTEQERRVALARLLTDDALIEDSVYRIRQGLHLPLKASAGASGALKTQIRLANTIHVKAVPQAVWVDARGYVSTADPNRR